MSDLSLCNGDLSPPFCTDGSSLCSLGGFSIMTFARLSQVEILHGRFAMASMASLVLIEVLKLQLTTS
ncbi:chlorophyll a/b-binding protein [Prochlorococcus sp. MIT 1303]|uniref:chlorophyll a/b-binding protein n=1 Tax=Prochlorococcus sp. MIT 1303 TaxID=1723647 RepID=UPI000940E79F